MEEKLIYKGIIFDLVQKDVEIKNKTYKRLNRVRTNWHKHLPSPLRRV